jgi:hypothetical protein
MRFEGGGLTACTLTIFEWQVVGKHKTELDLVDNTLNQSYQSDQTKGQRCQHCVALCLGTLLVD